MLLIRKQGESTWHSPTVTAYENEQELQMLICQSPGLLPGTSQVPMVIVDEMAVAAGYIDIVGVDAEGAITLAECKLKANPEIRRQVIGQVFAYAASLCGMSYDEFEKAFAARAKKSLVQSVAELGVEGWDEETFRARATENLREGRFRLVIAVDQITEELKNTVRYLNQHTIPEVQVLALELGRIVDECVEILMPVAYGEESAQTRPGGSGSRTAWNEDTFFASLADSCTPDGSAFVRRLFEFARQQGARFNWGVGPTASVTPRFPYRRKELSLLSLYGGSGTRPTLAINFEYLYDAPPECVKRLADDLRSIPAVSARYAGVEESGFNKRPGLPIDELAVTSGAADTIERAILAFLRCEG